MYIFKFILGFCTVSFQLADVSTYHILVPEKPLLNAVFGGLREYVRANERHSTTESSNAKASVENPRDHPHADPRVLSHDHVVTNQQALKDQNTVMRSHAVAETRIESQLPLAENLAPVKSKSQQKYVLKLEDLITDTTIPRVESPSTVKDKLSHDPTNYRPLDSKVHEMVYSYMNYLINTGTMSLIEDILSDTHKASHLPVRQTTSLESSIKADKNVDPPANDVSTLPNKQDMVIPKSLKAIIKAIIRSAVKADDIQTAALSDRIRNQDVMNGDVQSSSDVLNNNMSEQTTQEINQQTESIKGIINKLKLSESDASKLRNFGGTSPILVLQVNQNCNKTDEKQNTETNSNVKPEILQSVAKESAEPAAEYKTNNVAEVTREVSREQLQPFMLPSKKVHLQEAQEPTVVTVQLTPVSKPVDITNNLGGTNEDDIIVVTEKLLENPDARTGISTMFDGVKVITTRHDKERQHLPNHVHESSPVFKPLGPYSPNYQSGEVHNTGSHIPVVVVKSDHSRALEADSVNSALGNKIFRLRESQQPHIISARVAQTSTSNWNTNQFRQRGEVTNTGNHGLSEVRVRTVTPRNNGDNQPIGGHDVGIATGQHMRQSNYGSYVQPMAGRPIVQPVDRDPIVVVTKQAYQYVDVPITNQFAYNSHPAADHMSQPIRPVADTQFNTWQQQDASFQTSRDVNPMERLPQHQIPNVDLIGRRWDQNM